MDLDGAQVRCGITVRPAKPPVRNAELAPYLRSLVKCLVKVHRKPLAAQGFTVTEPKIKVYRSTVTAACGRFDQKGAPAYYCSADRTIYWPATRDDGREAYTFARLGYAALLAHEFGHHLQAVTGMVNEYGRALCRGRVAGRRGTCSAAGSSCRPSASKGCSWPPWPARSGSAPRTGRSCGPGTASPATRTHRTAGKPDHGTSAAQIRWLVRGLDSQDFGRCNTWSAPKSEVK